MTESDESRFGEVARGTLRYGADGMPTVWGARDVLMSVATNARRDASRADDIALSALLGRLGSAMDDFEDAVIRAHEAFGCTERGPYGAARYVCGDCRDTGSAAGHGVAVATERDEAAEWDAWRRNVGQRERHVSMATERNGEACTDTADGAGSDASGAHGAHPGSEPSGDVEITVGHITVPVRVRLSELRAAVGDAASEILYAADADAGTGQ